MPSINADSKRRVKVYMLSRHRQWDDKGTGYIETKEYHEKGSKVLSRNNRDVLKNVKFVTKPTKFKDKEDDNVDVEGEDVVPKKATETDKENEKSDTKTASPDSKMKIEDDEDEVETTPEKREEKTDQEEPSPEPEKMSLDSSNDDIQITNDEPTSPKSDRTNSDDIDFGMDEKEKQKIELEKVKQNEKPQEEEEKYYTTVHITVTSEEHPYQVLLETIVYLDVAYHKQQETLIVWTEPDDNDLALSFEEKTACENVWEHICDVQNKDPSCEVTHEIDGDPYTSNSNDSNGRDHYDNDNNSDDSHNNHEEFTYRHDSYNLPAPDVENLSQLRSIFSNTCSNSHISGTGFQMRRERVAKKVQSSEYIRKLTKIFTEAEASNNLQALFDLNSIIRSIFNLNMIGIYEILFNMEFLMDIIGILEYTEPPKDGKTEKKEDEPFDRPKHRQFITDKVKYHSVLDPKHEELIQKIHQTFRVQYIQDCVLPPPSLFEDNPHTAMSTWIFFNKVDIVNQITADRQIVMEIASKCRSPSTLNEKKIELGGFLKELCQFAQSLQHVEKDQFYQVLANNCILEVIEVMLACSGKDCNKVQSLGGEVLAYLIDWNPAFVRKYCLDVASRNTRVNNSLSQIPVPTPPASPPNPSDTIRSSANQANSIKPILKGQRERKISSSSSVSSRISRPNIITLLINQMISDTDNAHGGAVQLSALLKQLLDTDTLNSARSEISEFLGFFYNNCIKALVDPIYQITHSGKTRITNKTSSFIRKSNEK